MGFIEIPGFKGKVFVPEEITKVRKHNCPDCMDCQMCSDERCEACLKSHCNKSRNNVQNDNSCDSSNAASEAGK